jgi:hypothetical protein
VSREREVAETLADTDTFRFTEEDTVELTGLPGMHQLRAVGAR